MKINIYPLLIIFFIFIVKNPLFGHGMSSEEKQLIVQGGNFEYIYIGMTHMLSGYDHLLFVFAILFFVKNIIQIVKFITAFTLGHCLTLIFATFYALQINYYLIDAVIALSICFMALVNLNILRLDIKTVFLSIFTFGLIHGLGLSTRLQQLPLNEEELLLNIISFNIGIEVGQILALIGMFVLLNFLYKIKYFDIVKKIINIFLVFAGLTLSYFQVTEYLSESRNNHISAEIVYDDQIEIVIPAMGEKEYKLWVQNKKEVIYTWNTNKGTKLYFDFHGEPATATNGYFESYKEATSSWDSGVLNTTFMGTHGWYWKNSTSNDIKVTLSLKGDYKLSNF